MADISRSIGNLFVNIGAKTVDLDKGVESSRKKLNKLSSDVGAVVKDFAKLAAGAAAVGGALLGVTAHAGKSAREIKNLAFVSRESTTEFQKQAYAVASVGIEQEKYADILKDVNDRVGDFVAAGSGPMVDFFDRISPKVGVTVEQFRKLSGKDALQLYVSSLEKANVNQQDMTFFMEAIAGDATRLLPLFKNNGAEMNRMANEAERLGLVISDVDLQRLTTNNPFNKISQTIKVATVLVGNELMPIVTELANRFFAFAEAQGGIGNVVKNSMKTAALSIAKAADVVHLFKFAFKGLQLSATIVGAAITATFKEIAGGISSVIDFGINSVNKLITQVNKIPKIADMALIDTVSDSGFFKGLESASDDAWAQVNSVKSELDNIALAEYPSDNVAAFFDSIQQKATETAMKSRTMFTDLAGMGSGSGEGLGATTNDGVNLDQLKEKYLPLQELERAHLEEMALIGEEFELSKFESEEQWREAKLAAEQEYWDKRRSITESSQNGIQGLIQSFWSTNVSETASALGNMFASFSAHSKKMFKAMKAYGIANAVVNMWKGVSIGVSKGLAGIPEVAWALAQGATAINNIRSANPGGGSGGGAGGGAASSGSGPEPQQQQSQPEEKAFINISGGIDQNKLYSGRSFAEAIETAKELGMMAV